MSEPKAPINFGGIKEAREKIMTRPGTIAIFTIMEVKFGNTKNTGGYYMQVAFEDKTSSFTHSFFLSEKALPRVKYLLKVVLGREVEEQLSEEQIIKFLVNKQIALKVTGKVDTQTGKGYPDLSFGGFAKPAGEMDFLEFNSQENKLNTEALEAMARQAANPDDEGGRSSGSEESGGGERKREKF